MDAVECMFLLERFLMMRFVFMQYMYQSSRSDCELGAGKARKDNKYRCFGSNFLRVVSSMYAETYVRTYVRTVGKD